MRKEQQSRSMVVLSRDQLEDKHIDAGEQHERIMGLVGEHKVPPLRGNLSGNLGEFGSKVPEQAIDGPAILRHRGW